MHGDWDEAGSELDADLNGTPAEGEAEFVKTDVTDYDSVLRLFDTAWKKYGRVDIAISNAGIQEAGNWFDPALSLETIKTARSPLPVQSLFPNP